MKKRVVIFGVLLLGLVWLGWMSWVKFFGPIRGLTHQDPNVRAQAVLRLETSWVPDPVGRLRIALNDEHEIVRNTAASALARIADQAALEALISALEDEHVRVRQAAASGLGQFRRAVEDPAMRARAIETLIRLLRDPEVRRSVPYALCGIYEPEIEPVIRVMKDGDDDICISAQIALGRIGDRAIAPLLRALQDDDMRVRWAAGTGLMGAVRMDPSGYFRDERPPPPGKEVQEALAKHAEEWKRHQENVLAKLDAFGPRVSSIYPHHVEDIWGLGFSRVSQLTDDDLVHLQGLFRLKYLSLGAALGYTDTGPVPSAGRSRVTDRGLERLKVLANLESLDLGGSQVTGPGLRHLEGLAGLRRLGLSCTQVTDAGLEHVTGLSGLEMLGLEGCQVTDAGLEHLKALTRLQKLELGWTRISGSGIANLKGLHRLTDLSVKGPRITDAELQHVRGLTNLEHLDLFYAQVTDAGLAHLKGLTSLRTLNLGVTKVTDAGLEHLQGLTRLHTLRLYRSQITGPGLVHLKGLTSLIDLDLSQTQVTDAALQHLKGLTELQFLSLLETNVTDEGVKSLRRSLPKCRIVSRFRDLQ